jgi:acyl-CoA thioesterase FadM
MRNVETGEVAATARLTGVHIDAVSRKACALPEAAAMRARDLVRPYDFGDRS